MSTTPNPSRDTVTDDDTQPTIRPFADWLREQAGGETHDELGEGLHDLIARVRDTGKKGTLQLTVTVDPLKNDTDVLVVTDEIKLKLPEHDRKGSMFYADDDNNLRRNDPRQLTFDTLREVPTPPADVNPDTGEITDSKDA